jgi:hypothetical protein
MSPMSRDADGQPLSVPYSGPGNPNERKTSVGTRRRKFICCANRDCHKVFEVTDGNRTCPKCGTVKPSPDGNTNSYQQVGERLWGTPHDPKYNSAFGQYTTGRQDAKRIAKELGLQPRE